MMNFLSNRALALIAAAALLMVVPGLLLSCQSRFHEPSPKGVTPTGPSSDETVREKVALDSRLDEIQRSAKQVQGFLLAIRDRLKRSEDRGSYSPIDFLVQVNENAKDSIPVRENEKRVRYQEVQLPPELLTQECKKVQIKIEQTKITEKDPAKGVDRVVEEGSKYFIKTCAERAEFRPFFEAKTIGNSYTFKFLSDESVEKLFEKVLVKGLKPETGCTITEKNTSIDKFECRDLLFGLSEKTSLLVKEIGFRSSDDVQFQALYEIYRDNKLECTGTATLYRNGRKPEASTCTVSVPNEPKVPNGPN